MGYNILLVEDNEDHAELIIQVLEEEGRVHQIYWVKDGQEALDYLFQRCTEPKNSVPALILLDLKLPKVNGLEVLKEIKENDVLQVIPVVMLTTSNRNEEISSAYRLGVNSYVTKPVKFEEYYEKIKSLEHFWLKTNQGP